jgi:predicted restriction endonuclease
VWEEYHTNAVELVPQGQQLFEALFAGDSGKSVEVISGKGISRTSPPSGETEKTVMTKQRRGQQYFREIVLNNYDGQCAITGLPVRELLIASHILPWSGYENERLNIRNGICLNRLHDAAFDQGLIGFDDGMQLLLSTRIRLALPNASVVASFAAYEGQELSIPTDGINPDPAFLAMHRKKFGFEKYRRCIKR